MQSSNDRFKSASTGENSLANSASDSDYKLLTGNSEDEFESEAKQECGNSGSVGGVSTDTANDSGEKISDKHSKPLIKSHYSTDGKTRKGLVKPKNLHNDFEKADAQNLPGSKDDDDDSDSCAEFLRNEALVRSGSVPSLKLPPRVPKADEHLYQSFLSNSLRDRIKGK